MSDFEKIEALLRLARDPQAAPNEARNALSAARKLAAKADASGVHQRPRAPTGRVESRGGVECWVGDPPVHGPRCRQTGAGCPDCLRVIAFRAWLAGQQQGAA